jgi:ElaB/YqjD/DUF883 family membrane-anchored ribosome-binding protein
VIDLGGDSQGARQWPSICVGASVGGQIEEWLMDRTRKLNRLVSDTEELLGKLPAQNGPEVQELRNRLEQSVTQTKDALARQQDLAHVNIRDVAGSLNDYVRSHPWMALATGVLVASTIGILATSAAKRSLHH